VLVVGLLGGGLLSLLLVNTVLAAGSYQITALQQANAAQTDQVATLRQQVASDRSAATIQRRAIQLGMVRPALINFLNLNTGRITKEPVTDPGIPVVPGWAP
jgi:cell division protein FtsB